MGAAYASEELKPIPSTNLRKKELSFIAIIVERAANHEKGNFVFIKLGFLCCLITLTNCPCVCEPFFKIYFDKI